MSSYLTVLGPPAAVGFAGPLLGICLVPFQSLNDADCIELLMPLRAFQGASVANGA
jgi:hypothetical protein